MQKITTFLMFYDQAKDAIDFYIALFKNSKIDSITYYDAGQVGREFVVQRAVFTLNGQQFIAIDSVAKQPFTFTPATSLFVQCESEKEINELYMKLSEFGNILMPLDKYEFSGKFAWVADKFGVSWQLNLV